MPEPDLTALFLRPLEGAGLDRYMVSGSIASIEYGEPRATLDVDVAKTPARHPRHRADRGGEDGGPAIP